MQEQRIEDAKDAVLTPIPRASVSTATAVNPGFLRVVALPAWLEMVVGLLTRSRLMLCKDV